MQEDVERREGDASFAQASAAFANVRRAGEDLDIGAEALPRGRRLDGLAIALAAALDAATLRVHRRPRVAVLSTGDELRPPGSEAKPGTIPESNGPMVAALARRAGADVTVLPKTNDEPAALDAVLGPALDAHDLLVTIGGVSVGDYDEVKPALERAGAQLDFWKVAIRPGKPLVFGGRSGSLVLGLPGNPVSAGITFLLFGMPIIRRLAGENTPAPPRLSLALTAPLEQRPGRLGFYRGVLEGNQVRPLPNQSSGSSVSLAHADCLIVVEADSQGYEAGELAQVIRLRDL
jgi:molybdopterin molybdotransferase